MIFLSVAKDKADNLRIYLNKEGKLHCSNSINTIQLPVYLGTIIDTVMSFGDPLKATHWDVAKDDYAPKTPRKAVGLSDSHSRITLATYTKQNELAEQKIVDEGMRFQISSSFYLLVDRLFNTGLDSTLDEQSTWRPSKIKPREVK